MKYVAKDIHSLDTTFFYPSTEHQTPPSSSHTKLMKKNSSYLQVFITCTPGMFQVASQLIIIQTNLTEHFLLASGPMLCIQCEVASLIFCMQMRFSVRKNRNGTLFRYIRRLVLESCFSVRHKKKTDFLSRLMCFLTLVNLYPCPCMCVG